MTDIDHIVTDMTAIEYSDKKAVALIEYKHTSNYLDLKSANIAATEDVANRAGLPYFVVQYDPIGWEFLIRPRNEQARAFVSKRTWMSEQEFVSLLHRLRGKTAPAELLATLNGDPSEQQDNWEVNWPIFNPAVSEDDSIESLSAFLGEPWDDWDNDEDAPPCVA